MTASTISSSIITNQHSNTGAITYNELGAKADAKLRIACGSMEVATTSIDEQGDVILLFPVRGNESIVSLYLFNDDLDSGSTPALAVDVGLYKNVNGAGTSATVVDQDAIASAITQLQAASVVGAELRFEADDIANIQDPVWTIGGESSAHSDVRYVGLTVTTAAATAAAGTLSWRAYIVSP